MSASRRHAHTFGSCNLFVFQKHFSPFTFSPPLPHADISPPLLTSSLFLLQLRNPNLIPHLHILYKHTPQSISLSLTHGRRNPETVPVGYSQTHTPSDLLFISHPKSHLQTFSPPHPSSPLPAPTIGAAPPASLRLQVSSAGVCWLWWWQEWGRWCLTVVVGSGGGRWTVKEVVAGGCGGGGI
ncbi:hypothetical protein Hanom_Chr10g00888511 [Helianthus anomalus]